MDPNHIFIAAPKTDDHANHLSTVLKRLSLPFTIDSLELQSHLPLDLDPKNSGHFFHTLSNTPEDKRISVWWRRPARLKTEFVSKDSDWFHYVHSQWQASLSSHLASAEAFFVNPIQQERQALLKPYQLKIAHKLGLSIPETLITNNFERASIFLKTLARDGKRCIFKPLTPGIGPNSNWAETRTIDLSQLAIQEQSLTIAPVIFQECIERGKDFRITIFGTEVFVAEVTNTTEGLVDWRIDPKSEYKPTTISNQILEKLSEFLRALGLVTGSFDLRATDDGEIYFFEVNPSGQFLYLEYYGFPDITERFARYLAYA